MVLAGGGRLLRSKAALAIRRISAQGNSFPGAVTWRRTTEKSQRQAGKEQQRKRGPAPVRQHTATDPVHETSAPMFCRCLDPGDPIGIDR